MVERETRKRIAALAVLLLLAAFLLSSHLDAPFDTNHIGFTGAWYSLSARNLLTWGPGRLWGCLSIESGPPVGPPRLYLDHPPMVAWVLAGVFRLFGEGELQARTTALALSLAGAVFFFLFALRLFRGRVGPALLGVLLAVATPVWAFYGTLVDPHGPGLLLSMGGALWASARWEARRRRGDLLLLAGFLALGCLYDWAALLIAGPVGLWFLLFHRRRGGGEGAWTAWGTWAFLFVLLLLQVHLAARATGGRADLLGPLAKRSALGASGFFFQGRRLSVGEVLFQVARWNWKGIPLPLTLAGFAGALLAFRDARRGEAPGAAALLWVPLLMGAAISLLFLQAAFEHDYLQIYFAPGAGLGAAYLFDRILRALPRRRRLLQAGALAFLVLSLGWGFHRSRSRWAAQEPGLDRYRKAGALLASKVRPDEYLLSSTGFLPPLAYYSRRKIFWEVRAPWALPRPERIAGLRPGGILLSGGEEDRFLEERAAERGLRRSLTLAGGDLRFLPGGGEEGGEKTGR